LPLAPPGSAFFSTLNVESGQPDRFPTAGLRLGPLVGCEQCFNLLLRQPKPKDMLNREANAVARAVRCGEAISYKLAENID